MTKHPRAEARGCMMSPMRTLGALAVVLLLSGCGGGAEEAPDADELAAQFECTGDSAEEPEKVSCETDEGFFGITVYEDNDQRDADVEAAAAAGVTVLVGDGFVIDSSDPTALEAVQEKVGGELSG